MSKESQRALRAKYPWRYHLYDARKRCTNKNQQYYYYYCYGGRGIKCLLTNEEIEELWFRDRAYTLEIPSLDRKDKNKNYTYGNCKFIEMIENAIKDKQKPILQYSLNGVFIKEWISAMNAERTINICHSSISSVCQNKRNSAGGFVWKYKDKNQ